MTDSYTFNPWIRPEWPAPPGVRAVSTTRRGGYSTTPYDSLNLGDHVGDDPLTVRQNRAHLKTVLNLPSDPLWLQQVHGCDVVEGTSGVSGCQADAITTSTPGVVCAVLTADCLPLLLCNRSGTRVAAVHAGWRGLCAGVIESALDRFAEPGEELLAWLGPAIGPMAFEVGNEVRLAFLEWDPANEVAFLPGVPGHWLANIYRLAENRLNARNIGFIGGGGRCTLSQPERFFSYRRDGVTGRMASLIWIE